MNKFYFIQCDRYNSNMSKPRDPNPYFNTVAARAPNPNPAAPLGSVLVNMMSAPSKRMVLWSEMMLT